jgi:uncharacterized membrane protein
MPAAAQEWLNLIVRWVHVVAAIMWIGDSFLFMWLDSHLSPLSRPYTGDAVGELWMTHSGGFYEVVKRRSLAKDELPPKLYWFKWESYSTWLSGFCLLLIVYHANGASLLVDPRVRALSPGMAAALSLLSLPLAYGLYELLWLTPLARHGKAFGLVGLALIAALAHGYQEIFSARGAFLQVGAVLGTVMAANVFFRIIPAQRHMLAATRAGTPVDTRYGLRAKGRSIQNHYLTLPVLFTMLSNHFPSTYGSAHPWQVLVGLCGFGAGLKYVMNRRAQTPAWAYLGTLAALGMALHLSWPVDVAAEAKAKYASAPKVAYAQVDSILQSRCVTCHAAHPQNPGFTAPPLGVELTSPDLVSRHAERVFMRAVATRTMPLGNLTGMTAEERETLGAWFAQGADVHAQGETQASGSGPTPGAPSASSPARTEASRPAPPSGEGLYAENCVSCHGEHGDGQGPASSALTPKPRNFTDAAWQASVTDDQIRLTVLGGGPVRGKSALMPSFAGVLHQDPALLDALVRQIRGFKPRL